MCWRTLSKLQKTVCVMVFYFVVYVLLSFAITPVPLVKFVADNFRVGDKYVLMFLVGPGPAFSDGEGARVLASRRCGKCFITNNKGFLPMTEYDAVLVYGQRNLLSEAEAAMDPGKRYLIETTSKCLKTKLQGCSAEPKITSFSTQDSYSLCSLCKHLIQEKQNET